jgi:hypothetical protein
MMAPPLRKLTIEVRAAATEGFGRGQPIARADEIRPLQHPRNYYEPDWPAVLAFTRGLIPRGNVELAGTQALSPTHVARLVRQQTPGCQLETGHFDAGAEGYQALFYQENRGERRPLGPGRAAGRRANRHRHLSSARGASRGGRHHTPARLLSPKCSASRKGSFASSSLFWCGYCATHVTAQP